MVLLAVFPGNWLFRKTTSNSYGVDPFQNTAGMGLASRHVHAGVDCVTMDTVWVEVDAVLVMVQNLPGRGVEDIIVCTGAFLERENINTG